MSKNRVWKGNKFDLTVETSGWYPLNQVFKITSPVISYVDVMYPLMWCAKKCTLLLRSSSKKMCKPRLIIRKRQSNPNWETVYKILDQYSSKHRTSWKARKHWEPSTDQKSLRTWQLKAMQYPGLDPGTVKGHQRKEWWHLKKICDLVSVLKPVLFLGFDKYAKNYVNIRGTPLAVRWLRLHAPNAGSQGSIPGQRTRHNLLPQRKEPVCRK